MQRLLPSPWRRLAWPALPLLVVAALVGACDDDATDPVDDGEDPGDDRATVSVFITDAPGDVSRVWVEVTGITLVGGAGGPVTLLDEPTDLIEITALRDQAMLLVDDEEVEVGTSGQLRFIIGDAVLETDDGGVFVLGDAEHPDGLETTGDLMCPSCSQTGIKVLLSGDVVMEDGDNGILLDFDVSQSFGHQAGQSGRWIMRPVIHGASVDAEDVDDAAFEIRGTVSLGTDGEGNDVVIPACPAGVERSLEDFVPVAVATTLTDDEGAFLTFGGETEEDGSFELDVLGEDAWDLTHLETLEVDGGTLTFAAEVTPAQVTLDAENPEADGVAYTVTSATCEEDDGGEGGDGGGA